MNAQGKPEDDIVMRLRRTKFNFASSGSIPVVFSADSDVGGHLRPEVITSGFSPRAPPGASKPLLRA